MSKSAISWTDYTFNPWWGCTKCMPECDHCYAESWASRMYPGHNLWGPTAGFRFFRDKHWDEPFRWERLAIKNNRRYKVFCGSMCDIFQPRNELDDARARLWFTIRQTPHLDWLLLTKRPLSVPYLIPDGWLDDHWPPNAWLGCTAGCQDSANKIVPLLASFKDHAKIPYVFLSAEPLIGPIDLARAGAIEHDAIGGENGSPAVNFAYGTIDWVIAGGESGRDARPMNLSWLESMRTECEFAGISFFVKQTGNVLAAQLGLSGKGDRMDEWPESIRIQQFPDQNH